ncbi:hypothetical protein ABKV19_023155 [Rosa sericea]
MHHPVSDPHGFKLGLAPSSSAKPLGVSRTRSESFHGTHKVPVGDTPYVRAKNVQMSSGCVWGVVNHLKVVKDSSELH